MEFKLMVCSSSDLNDNPEYAKVDIDSKRLNKLKEYAAIVKSIGVYSLVNWDSSTKWFSDEECQIEVRMDARTVHVFPHGFNYEAYVRNMDVVCITSEILFRDLEGKDLDEEEEIDQPNTQTDPQANPSS